MGILRATKPLEGLANLPVTTDLQITEMSSLGGIGSFGR